VVIGGLRMLGALFFSDAIEFGENQLRLAIAATKLSLRALSSAFFGLEMRSEGPESNT